MLVRAALVFSIDRAILRLRVPSKLSFKFLIGNVPSLAHRPLDSLLQPFLYTRNSYFSRLIKKSAADGLIVEAKKIKRGKVSKEQNPEEILD